MSRCRFCLALAALLAVAFAGWADGPSDDFDTRIKKDLSVQTAMARARLLMADGQAQKAVEVLEEQLRNVNGKNDYLALLRDAYRAHIRDLYLAGRPDDAKRYLDRLCILDPAAANDLTLRPQTAALPKKADPPAKQNIFPTFNPANLKIPNLFAKKEEPARPPVVQASVARGVPDASISDDPFDRKHQREGIAGVNPKAAAQEYLKRGADEFRLDRYAQARICFERAYQADTGTLDVCKEQWAYCILKGVAELMDQPGVLPGRSGELQQQVDAAIRMAPTKMMASGQQLLEQLDRRSKAAQGAAPGLAMAGPAGNLLPSVPVRVRHWGQNREGWQVVDTAHFRIFHRQDDEFGERVARIAESTRAAMYKKWFNSEGIEWEPKCELVMHPNHDSYMHYNPKAPGVQPGHSTIIVESGRVISRRVDLRLDGKDVLEAVLPHETTHVVLAGMFSGLLPPRWADEGIAIMSEPEIKIAHHRRNLHRHHGDGQLFTLKELMELGDYPKDSSKINLFYAQSVALCEFLTAERGPKTLADFVKDGMRVGYETALRRHYDMTFTQLEERFTQKMLTNSSSMK